MNFTVKRLLVIFSVALNIGFFIMAIVLFYNRPKPFHANETVLEILSRLDLPADVEKSVTSSIEKMEAAHRNFAWKLHQARNESITLLSRPELVDEKRFELLNNAIIDIMIQQNHVIREHLIEIRNQLGKENGARFFSEILKHVEKRGLMEPS